MHSLALCDPAAGENCPRWASDTHKTHIREGSCVTKRSRSKRLRATLWEMKVGPSGSAIRPLIPSHRGPDGGATVPFIARYRNQRGILARSCIALSSRVSAMFMALDEGGPPASSEWWRRHRLCRAPVIC
jgi:hypothetical protein